MNNVRLLHDNLLVDLVNFSSYDKPLSADYFVTKYEKHKLTKRQIRLIVNEIINDRKQIVCSTDSGYYIPKTKEEAWHGVNWIGSMEERLQLRKDTLIEQIQHTFDKSAKNTEPDLFNQQAGV